MKPATLTFALAHLCSVGAFAPKSHLSFSAALRSKNHPLVPSSSLAARLEDGNNSETFAVATTPTLDRSSATLAEPSAPAEETLGASDTNSEEYKQGFAIIAFITLLNASLAPVWHTVFANGGPPPLFLNAIVSVVAFVGLLVLGPLLDRSVDSMSSLAVSNEEKWGFKSFRGGMELGFWKGLGKYGFIRSRTYQALRILESSWLTRRSSLFMYAGTTCHIFGMSLTTANHGAFLLQLTTLIVPVLQSFRGERIPRQIQLAVVLALAGIVAFTQDPGSASTAALDPDNIRLGDTLVLGAAVFYSFYDIQTFYWGREVPRTELVTIKIGFQAVLSCLLCAAVNGPEVQAYLADGPDYEVLVPTILWSGLIVNALATFLQVGGMQAVGPTRAQTIFASQPLWAGCLNFVFLGEIVGTQGFVGGGAFLGALFLAATAKAPDVEAVEAAE
jgi:drug/metabolite transporter (DMT)-like permease